jgi:ATP-dependent Clp protease ATP-binding subunit ClpC
MFEIFTTRARKVIEYAKAEAKQNGDDCVGTQHILYGLVKEGSGVGHKILTDNGVTLIKIKEETEKVVQKGDGIPKDAPFSPRAKNLFTQAIEEATLLEHRYVGTEHILLALLVEKESVAVQILTNFKLDPAELYKETLALLGQRYKLKLIGDDIYSVLLNGQEITRYDRNSDCLLIDKPMQVGILTEIVCTIRNFNNEKK